MGGSSSESGSQPSEPKDGNALVRRDSAKSLESTTAKLDSEQESQASSLRSRGTAYERGQERLSATLPPVQVSLTPQLRTHSFRGIPSFFRASGQSPKLAEPVCDVCHDV